MGPLAAHAQAPNPQPVIQTDRDGEPAVRYVPENAHTAPAILNADNVSVLMQVGNGNAATTTQNGNVNVAQLAVLGNANTTAVVQQGSRNALDATLRGSNSALSDAPIEGQTATRIRPGPDRLEQSRAPHANRQRQPRG
ncbi:MAG: hypothetical protein WKG07_24185 [Hymenobacter sp.]